MLGIADYGAFVAAIVVFLMIPGPGNVAIVASSSKGGFWGGMASTLGIVLGDQVLLWLAVAGVAALLKANPMVFHGVQWAGAAYLAYLGLKMCTRKAGAAPMLAIKPHHYCRQSLFITLLNPKAIVFYMAFFPLFVDPQTHQGGLTFAAMAATIAVLTLAYGFVATLLTHFFAAKVKRTPRLAAFFERIAGVALLGFGIKLALSR